MNIKHNTVTSTLLLCLLCANSSKGMDSHKRQNRNKLVEAIELALQEIQIQQQPPQRLNLEAGVHQDNRKKGQDRYEIREAGKYYIGAVYDGHGPADDVVNYVRKNLIEYIITYTRNGASILDSIKNTFTQTECEINDCGLEGGTTALIAILDKDTMKLHVANLGDCRAVLCRNKNPFELSSDHKPNKPDEQKRIEEKGGYIEYDGVHRINGLAVSRSFGDLDLKEENLGCIISEPEIVEESLQPEDQFLILASDGIWDVIDNQEAVTMVQRAFKLKRTPLEAAAELVLKAKMNCSMDDLTVLIVRFNN
ncbi:protein serine/threonine phosphatase 2C family protein [Candidatus Dependentiae bacterium]|nr:MAG: protein serine/threonine phosphatase 2C family protein [Candidatus Dependentiae bacterium]